MRNPGRDKVAAASAAGQSRQRPDRHHQAQRRVQQAADQGRAGGVRPTAVLRPSRRNANGDAARRAAMLDVLSALVSSLMADWIHPTDAAGNFAGDGLIPIDAAHRQGVPHRGVWLHVLTEADGCLLLVHRSPQMVTCPASWSIIGEHNAGREEDSDCARRAVREELPGLAPLLATSRLRIEPLRSQRRWFLFDCARPFAERQKGSFFRTWCGVPWA